MTDDNEIQFIHDLNNKFAVVAGKLSKLIKLNKDRNLEQDLQKAKKALDDAIEITKERRENLRQSSS